MMLQSDFINFLSFMANKHYCCSVRVMVPGLSLLLCNVNILMPSTHCSLHCLQLEWFTFYNNRTGVS